MWARVAIALVLFLLPSAVHAQSEKRIALLIGNKDYKVGVGTLTNPLNDIRIVGEALKAVGFEVLKPVENAQRSAMLIAIHAFAAKLKAAGPDAVGFLYYSGHGIASAGENYLIPTDVDEPSTVLLSVQGVKQSEVLGILRGEAPNAAHFLVLDACRHTLRGARGGKGFVPVGQQSGVLVAFAAEPGKTASDIGQGSGPYAAALATELVKPGQSDLIMFHNVRVAVMDKTKGDQVPWTEDGIQRRQRVLFGGEAKAPPSSQVSPPALSADKPARKNEAPTVSGMLRCESYPERAACELNTNCSWADNRKHCEKKSGGLATAILEALAPSKPTSQAPCAGVEALVGNEKRCLKPGDSFKDCPDCPEMVVVPPGSFTMGSNDGASDQRPAHEVTIVLAFAVGRFEVKRSEYAVFAKEQEYHGKQCGIEASPPQWKTRWVKEGYSWQKPGFAQTDKHPAVCISWNDAKNYVEWLAGKSGKPYRLLSEAEWEYVARAGTKTTYPWGTALDQLCTNGNGVDRTITKEFAPDTFASCEDGFVNTAPVGSFKANAFGLHDLFGNAGEWVEDCNHRDYHEKPPGVTATGRAWTNDCNYWKNSRGGSWRANATSADRGGGNGDYPNNDNGIRVARTL